MQNTESKHLLSVPQFLTRLEGRLKARGRKAIATRRPLNAALCDEANKLIAENTLLTERLGIYVEPHESGGIAIIIAPKDGLLTGLQAFNSRLEAAFAREIQEDHADCYAGPGGHDPMALVVDCCGDGHHLCKSCRRRIDDCD